MVKKKKLITTVVLLVLFILFTVLVQVVDVQPIGPKDTSVGFAALNGAVFNGAGINHAWDTLSDIVLGISIIVAALFFVMGLVQLLKRKSIKKVDKNILLTAALYVVVVVLYVVFAKVDINFRPVLEDGMLESSYPSSHVLISLSVLMAAFMETRKYIKQKNIRAASRCVIAVLIVLGTIGRIFSGMHWFTDIIGAVLLAATLVSAYSFARAKLIKKKKTHKR